MSEPPKQPVQQGLFGPLGGAAARPREVGAASIPDEWWQLAARLPAGVRPGTSSWNFSGWRGLVYAADAPVRQLSARGLQAYGQQPLFRSVGIDRSFYAPLRAAEFASYAALVPADFRFLVKAWGELLGPAHRRSIQRNSPWLDAAAVAAHCVEPAVAGLGHKLGVLLLQLPPQAAATVREPARFAAQLHDFLRRLPVGVDYAVELRDAALLTSDYADALADTKVQHCFAVHPSMPTLAQQRELMADCVPRCVRWLLRRDLRYEAAQRRYEPYDKIVDPDPDSRDAIVGLCLAAIAADQPITVVINNKAEGSAPHSVVELAKALVQRLAQSPATGQR